MGLCIQRQDGPAGNAAKRGALYSYMKHDTNLNMKRQNENPQRYLVKQQQGASAHAGSTDRFGDAH